MVATKRNRVDVSVCITGGIFSGISYDIFILIFYILIIDLCNIKISGTFEEARIYALGSRRIRLPIYNYNRLKEQPFPDQFPDERDINTNQCELIEELIDRSSAGPSHALNSSANLIFSSEIPHIENRVENPIEQTEEQTHSSRNSTECDTRGDTQNDLAEIEAENNIENLEMEIKSEVLLEPSEASKVQLINIIDAQYIEIDDAENDKDDIVICVGSKGFGAPFKMTSSCLIKRENDLLSGDTPFNTNVSAQTYIKTSTVIVFFS